MALRTISVVKVRHLLLAIFLFIADAKGLQSPPPWLPGFQSAFQQLQMGKSSAALDSFALLWKQNSHDALLATSIGAALDSNSHHQEATVWYERALAIEPTFRPALEDLALNCAARGKLADAADLLRKILKQDPDNGRIEYSLGLIDLRLQRYQEAAAVLERALASPNLPAPGARIRLARATALFHLGKYSEVVRLMSISPAPENPSEFTLLASAEALSGDLPAAIHSLQGGIAAYPTEPDLYFRLALTLAEGRRDQDAQAALDSASEQIPKSPLIDYGKALLAEMNGLDDDAIGWAEKSLRKDGGQPGVLGLLATLFEKRGRTEEAARAYQNALRHGASTYTTAKYADLLIRLRRSGEAEAQLRDMLDRYPEDPELNRELGKLYRAEGKPRKAESSLRTSIHSDPADPRPHYILAQVLREQGRLEEANQELQEFKRAKEKSENIRILERIPDSN